MAVYVDDGKWNFGRMKMSHMMADTMDELLAMADEIGVSRKWLQTGRYVHFDICQSKRALAVAAGAVEVTSKQMIIRFRPNPTPPDQGYES